MKLASSRLRRLSLLFVGLASVLALIMTLRAQPQTPPATVTLCVNASVLPGGAKDGSSWANAFDSLVLALAAAPSGARLWVAQGTYTVPPPVPPAVQTEGFKITKPLKLYGGFFGDENSVEGRHGSFQGTLLNGDRFFDDASGSYSDNANHVVEIETIDADGDDVAVVIDGFRIANGHGLLIPPPYTHNGGGIWAHCSDLHVANCFFDHNRGLDGGAIWFVSGCTTLPYPPALPEALTSILRVETCEFFANRADDKGGAIFAERVKGWVVNSKFVQNLGHAGGGAAFVWMMRQGHTLDFTNCLFWENYCTSVTSQGGALEFGQASSAVGDVARSNVVNCTFAGNNINRDYQSGSGPTCAAGQAVAVSANSAIGLYNSILWYNHDLCANLCNVSSAAPIAGNPVVEYCDVEWGWSGVTNLSVIPLFTAGHPVQTTFIAGCAPPPSVSIPLLTLRKASSTTAGSQCIDYGDHLRLPLDLLESNRYVNRTGWDEDVPAGVDFLDMGCYERP